MKKDHSCCSHLDLLCIWEPKNQTHCIFVIAIPYVISIDICLLTCCDQRFLMLMHLLWLSFFDICNWHVNVTLGNPSLITQVYKSPHPFCKHVHSFYCSPEGSIQWWARCAYGCRSGRIIICNSCRHFSIESDLCRLKDSLCMLVDMVGWHFSMLCV